jgi:heterodisulfide reductase subunit C
MVTLGIKDESSFLSLVNQKSGCNVLECYQCGKCAATCPVSQFMDITPRQVMQFIKLGMKDEVYTVNSMWFCLTCSACSGRCPRQIDIPRVMEACRHLAMEENMQSSSKEVKDIRRFHEIFLDMVKRYGRGYDLRLMAEFNIRTRNFFKDMALAPAALGKGKIKLTSEKIKSVKAIQRMFKMAEKIEKQHNQEVKEEAEHKPQH